MNREHFAFRKLCILALICALLCTGCMRAQTASVPEIPDGLARNADGIPILKVYDTSKDEVEEMDLESYVMGVVAGEMKNTWPLEALKAQAILARTFTMKFLSTKKSIHDGADISTDVQEAQAYNADNINDRIRRAVNDTRGIVMSADGELPYAWFHAHSGGKTALPMEALEYSENPAYLTGVDSNESPDAPETVKNWQVHFNTDEVIEACAKAGMKIDRLESFEIGEMGESGRAVTFLVNGKEISAPSFRLQIGASKLKSTLIDRLEADENGVTFWGRGFGHGVGMSQWGAYQMAKEGSSAEKIIQHYFTGVEAVELW